ncbi:MAG: nitrate reductase cytochrome c-type subunit [Pseudoalteromonas distincta]|tara:strand:+ start:37885 stop:38373 length:489 start_codon:yes stop_codon:yes gene_type:complete
MKIADMLCMAVCLLAFNALAEDQDISAPDGLREGGTLYQNLPAPPMAGEPRHSGREVRNYPEQPPVIPHSIRNYQVDRRHNRCLECHSRNVAPDVGAPMISVTHFVGRDGQTRAAVVPSRYFCTQCHVPQTDARPLVESDFRSIDQVIQEEAVRRTGDGGQP